MKILDHYIAKMLLLYTLGVMIVGLSIYAFLNFINQVDSIGRANYTALEAIMYVVLDLPSVLYQHSSVIILLGCVLGLGHLAATSQLIIIQGSGYSVIHITRVVIIHALWMIATITFIGETMVPSITQYAQLSRSKALGESIQSANQQGFWLKEGHYFINVGKNFSGKIFENVALIKLNQSNTLDSATFSKKATFDGKNLNLKDATQYTLKNTTKPTRINRHYYQQYPTTVSFDHNLIDDLTKKPDELSIWNIYKKIQFLNDNELAADSFEVELYKRLIKPITLIAMIMLSMLFVFGSLRDASLGRKIFLGVALSLTFELLSQIGGTLSLRFDYNHFLSASLPTLIVLLFATILLYRKSVNS